MVFLVMAPFLSLDRDMAIHAYSGNGDFFVGRKESICPSATR